MDSDSSPASIRLVTTDDGSPTLFSEKFQAHYHSTHGALQESQHVFIREGLLHFLDLFPTRDELHILEIGMGTGLNVWLTALQSIPLTHYHAVEGYPVPHEVIHSMNYTSNDNDQRLFQNVHQLQWNEWAILREGFHLYKDKSLIEGLTPRANYDIVYFDAFGPRSQGHLWKEDVLSSIVASMNEDAILVTFCAQGAFKRTLRKLGLQVQPVPGPPGKREMTRAIKVS